MQRFHEFLYELGNGTELGLGEFHLLCHSWQTRKVLGYLRSWLEFAARLLNFLNLLSLLLCSPQGSANRLRQVLRWLRGCALRCFITHAHNRFHCAGCSRTHRCSDWCDPSRLRHQHALLTTLSRDLALDVASRGSDTRRRLCLAAGTHRVDVIQRIPCDVRIEVDVIFNSPRRASVATIASSPMRCRHLARSTLDAHLPIDEIFPRGGFSLNGRALVKHFLL